MGFKRFLIKNYLTPGGPIAGHIIDAFDKKDKTGKGFVECLKDSVKETVCEDMPGTSQVYREGHKDGRIQGTAEQARRDERKFRQMHDKHEADRRRWNAEKQEYEDLLDDIENNL